MRDDGSCVGAAKHLVSQELRVVSRSPNQPPQRFPKPRVAGSNPAEGTAKGTKDWIFEPRPSRSRSWFVVLEIICSYKCSASRVDQGSWSTVPAIWTVSSSVTSSFSKKNWLDRRRTCRAPRR